MAYTKQEQIPFQKKRRGFKNMIHLALKQGSKTLYLNCKHTILSAYLTGRTGALFGFFFFLNKQIFTAVNQ